MQLRLALSKLQETQALDEVLLWGKIRGKQEVLIAGIIKDYYIALGIQYRGHQEFPSKRFFWAAGNFLFVPLPTPRPEIEEDAKRCLGYFTGEHEKVLKSVPKPGKDFTELERLAYVVTRIEHDTHVLPQGSFKFTPIQEYKKNDQFKGTLTFASTLGLAQDQLNKLDLYQHFRQVETAEKKELLARNEGILQTDVLDSLASDKPKGAWTLQLLSGSVATLRSLLWPGYVFYHLGLTDIYAGIYIGDGILNKDLPFML